MEAMISISEFAYQDIQMPENQPRIVSYYRATYWIGFLIPVISGILGYRLNRSGANEGELLNYVLSVVFFTVVWTSYSVLGIYVFYVKLLH